jgi:hypothetical protein
VLRHVLATGEMPELGPVPQAAYGFTFVQAEDGSWEYVEDEGVKQNEIRVDTGAHPVGLQVDTDTLTHGSDKPWKILDTPGLPSIIIAGEVEDELLVAAVADGDIGRRNAEAIVAEHNAALSRLLRWKAEAMEVMAGWHKVFEALGRPGQLGDSVYEASLAEVQRLVGSNGNHTAALASALAVNMPGDVDSTRVAENVEASLRRSGVRLSVLPAS